MIFMKNTNLFNMMSIFKSISESISNTFNSFVKKQLSLNPLHITILSLIVMFNLFVMSCKYYIIFINSSDFNENRFL